ncbi:MAG TPA: MFS transporter [Terriglobales bacterium]|nr:MFS transporter [Terriglobales bacterium]
MADTTMNIDRNAAERTALAVLVGISFCHLLNDMLQSLLPAIYPMIKQGFDLSFSQVGLITLVFQITASLLQPMVGLYTDRSPKNYALPVGMAVTLAGLLLLSRAPSFPLLLLAAALIGTGSSIFHPESSRVARLASGGRHGLAQSLFQVGGNLGSAIGPLAAAFLILPHGQSSVAWFSLAAMVAIIVLTRIGAWFGANRKAKGASRHGAVAVTLSRKQVGGAIAVLLALIFSKYFYLASLTSYYTFYLITRFGVSVQSAQIYLFVFLGAAAIGTIAGGPIGDHIGRKKVIWGSILGVLPFTLVLPYASLFWTVILTIPIGLILASAFSAIVVYAQELMPGRVGMVAGLFFGFAFGMGGVGAAVLGVLADWTDITTVYRLCAFLPAIGLLTALLPNIETARQRAKAS